MLKEWYETGLYCRRGAAPSDELDPVEAALEDPDGGRVSAGKAQGGRGVKEGEKSLDEFGNLPELLHGFAFLRAGQLGKIG